MYMLYKHKCSPVFDVRPRLHVILNDVKKVTLDVGSILPSPPSSKSSDIVVLTCKLIFWVKLNSFDLIFARSTCKHWLGSSTYVKRDLLNIITWSLGHASQNKRAFVFIMHIHLFYFFIWPIISPDKTLIHCLVSFIALWRCTEPVILTFNRLESIGANYMDTNSASFHQKPQFLFDWRKKYINILDGMGVSKLSGHFCFKVN